VIMNFHSRHGGSIYLYIGFGYIEFGRERDGEVPPVSI